MPARSSGAAPEPVAPLHVLVIDDEPADLELTRTALETVDPGVSVTTSTSRQVLQEHWLSTQHRWPDLILLDLHMPGIDGLMVLRWLKTHPVLRTIPVVVRSGNEYGRDVMEVYRAHASAFILKPNGFDALVLQMRALVTFWSLNRTLIPRIRLD